MLSLWKYLVIFFVFVVYIQNIAALLLKSYPNHIERELSILKRRATACPLGYGSFEHEFKLPDPNGMKKSLIHHPHKYEYFNKLERLFKILAIYDKSLPFIFEPRIFNNLSLFSKTSLFQTLSRLLSFNCAFHSGLNNKNENGLNYALINIHQKNAIQNLMPRKLNFYETKLFRLFKFKQQSSNNKKVSASNTLNQSKSCHIIYGLNQFKNRLNHIFHFNKWKNGLNWDKFWILGGSVMRCLLNSNKMNQNKMLIKNQDIDIFSINIGFNEFMAEIQSFSQYVRNYGYNVLLESRNHESCCVQNIYCNFCSIQETDLCFGERVRPIHHEQVADIIKIGKWQKFQFIWYDSLSKQSLMNVIDLDCCQIGFDGKSVLCTHAFIQVQFLYMFIC